MLELLTCKGFCVHLSKDSQDNVKAVSTCWPVGGKVGGLVRSRQVLQPVGPQHVPAPMEVFDRVWCLELSLSLCQPCQTLNAAPHRNRSKGGHAVLAV